MKAISKKSMKNPSTKIDRFAITSKPIQPPGRLVSSSSIHKSPLRPRNTSAKAVEPTSRNITIEVSRAVSSMVRRNAL